MARGNGYRPAELASSRVFSGIIVVFIIALGLATCLSEVGWVAAASTLGACRATQRQNRSTTTGSRVLLWP
jgi:hypothetical protein